MIEQNINTHIGSQLRKRRLMLGLSQEAVGRGIGMAAQQVQKYEKGTNVMNAQRLYDCAHFLKVPVAYFYEGVDAQATMAGFSEVEERFEHEQSASDRESLELLKSFKRIKDPALRKKVADLLRAMSLKDI